MTARKLLLLGEIGVGKTSLVRRLVHGALPSDYLATMGVDIYRYEMTGIGRERQSALELVVWDIDGSYGSRIFQHVYSRGASGALIVGDIMRRATLERMVELAEGFQASMPSRHFSFVVNKLDLIGTPDEALLPERLVNERHPLIWTSALQAYNVLDAFRVAADAIVRRED
jgi:GTPase SAR1 family protein